MAKVEVDLGSIDQMVLLDELRQRGMVICAFVAADVVSHHMPDMRGVIPPDVLARADVWLWDNAKWLEEAMTLAGNQYIGDADTRMEGAP